jgi:hypothetical protein
MFSRIKHSLLALALGMVMVAAAVWALTHTVSSSVEAAEAAPGLHLVDNGGNPISGTVRVLCYTDPVAGNPSANLMLTTTGGPITDLPVGCNYAAVLHLKHEQPSGKPDHGPAYWMYATSWPSGSTMPLTATGNVTITINDDWPLVLFNVVASLAWEPSPVSTYATALRQGLYSASEYLYDLTEGQMAFGPVTIHTGGRHWKSADFLFLPANDYRPGAYVGGIVSGSVHYSGAQTTTFTSANVYFGRYWDGTDAFDPVKGGWDQEDAFRTIAHEFGHYALFLYDEYQQTGTFATYCTCDDLDQVGQITGACGGVTSDSAASVMAYQYTASEFWHPTHVPTPTDACTTTTQWEVHGLSDWETLNRWHKIQGLNIPFQPVKLPAALAPGPDDLGITGDLFGRLPGCYIYLPIILRPGADSPSPTEPTIHVTLDNHAAVTETLLTQVYILEGMESGSPTRILHQGKVLADPDPDSGLLGHITLLGVKEGDRARIFVDRSATTATSGSRFVYPSTTVADSVLYDGFNALATTTSWDASLDIVPDTVDGRLVRLTAWLTSSTKFTQNVTAQLCVPDIEIGCPPVWKKTMTPMSGGKSWTTDFTPLPGTVKMPSYAVIRVEAPGTRELIRWFQVTTVGPAHNWAHAPLSDWHVTIDAGQALPGSGRCNKVVVMPAADYPALVKPLPTAPGDKPIQGIIGLPFDIDILLSADDACPQLGPGEHTLPYPVYLTMSYDQETINRLRAIHDLQEDVDLYILHYSRVDGAWSDGQIDRIVGRNTELNWLSATLSEDGIYAIGWAVP